MFSQYKSKLGGLDCYGKVIMRNNVVNLMSLSAIQGANALLPLLIFPYLYTVLGENEFSRVVIAEAISMYVLAFCLYSFDVTGVKELLHTESDAVNNSAQVYWSVLFFRLGVLLCLSIIILPITYIFFGGYFLPILSWLLFPLGMVLQSNYFFQAEERNFFFSIGVVFSRLISCLAIYVSVNSHSDMLLAINLLGGSFLLSGVTALLLIQYKHPFKLHYLSFERTKLMFQQGLAIFIGNMSVSLFRGSNVIILSLVSIPSAVAVYSLAEKIIKSIQALARPLNQLAYPKVVKEFSLGGSVGIFDLIWKYTKPQLLFLTIIIGLLLITFYFIAGHQDWININIEVLNLIILMSLSVLFGVSNYMFGTVGLNLTNQQNYYAKAVLITGVVILPVSFSLGYFFGAIGAGVAFVSGELLLLLLLLAKYSKG